MKKHKLIKNSHFLQPPIPSSLSPRKKEGNNNLTLTYYFKVHGMSKFLYQTYFLPRLQPVLLVSYIYTTTLVWTIFLKVFVVLMPSRQFCNYENKENLI